jgi:hypothetical protein
MQAAGAQTPAPQAQPSPMASGAVDVPAIPGNTDPRARDSARTRDRESR